MSGQATKKSCMSNENSRIEMVSQNQRAQSTKRIRWDNQTI